MKDKEKISEKNARLGRKFIKLMIVLAVLCAILVFLLLFRLENVLVTGNDRYSDDEIKALVINENVFYNTLLLCLLNSSTETPDVPLLESIEVIYVDRNTIQLEANEKMTIGMFQVGDKVCCIDQDGLVVEILDYEDSVELELPLIYNLATSGTLGEEIDADDEVLNALQVLMSLFKRYEIMPDEIYIEEELKDEDDEESVINTYQLVFGEITVDLGVDDLLEEKMRRVAAILPYLEDESGTLHLESYDEDTENIIFDTNG